MQRTTLQSLQRTEDHDMPPITDTPEMREAIGRTTLGVVPFGDIVKTMRYTKKHFHLARGTWWDEAADECFISVERTPHLGPIHGSFRGSEALHGALANPQWLYWWGPGEKIGAVEVIPWPTVGLCLIILKAPQSYIGSVWLAFCPLDGVVEALRSVSAPLVESQL